MRLFDPRNIDQRAGKLLNYHVELLGSRINNFIRNDENYYQYKKNKEDYIQIGYNKRKKLLTRTYNLEVKSVVYGLNFSESFSLKLQFKGFPKITAAVFKGNKKSGRFQGYFDDQALMKAILREAGIVEIAYVTIQYHQGSGKMEITVCPYAGAYLWVIFPPVFYDMRLKEKEIKAVYRIMELLTEHAGEWPA